MIDCKHARHMDRIQPFRVMALLAEAKQLEASGRSIIHMEVGEPDFDTPQPIIEAGIQALLLSVLGVALLNWLISLGRLGWRLFCSGQTGHAA